MSQQFNIKKLKSVSVDAFSNLNIVCMSANVNKQAYKKKEEEGREQKEEVIGIS